MKFCKDCKHAKRDWLFNFDRCTNKEVIKTSVSPVTGKVSYYEDCLDLLRMPDYKIDDKIYYHGGKCGIEAKYFEPK